MICCPTYSRKPPPAEQVAARLGPTTHKVVEEHASLKRHLEQAIQKVYKWSKSNAKAADKRKKKAAPAPDVVLTAPSSPKSVADELVGKDGPQHTQLGASVDAGPQYAGGHDSPAAAAQSSQMQQILTPEVFLSKLLH